MKITEHCDNQTRGPLETRLKTRKKLIIKGERADINTNEARPVSEKSHILMCGDRQGHTAQGKTVNWRNIPITLKTTQSRRSHWRRPSRATPPAKLRDLLLDSGQSCQALF